VSEDLKELKKMGIEREIEKINKKHKSVSKELVLVNKQMLENVKLI
jgi:hypothetical protein